MYSNTQDRLRRWRLNGLIQALPNTYWANRLTKSKKASLKDQDTAETNDDRE